MRIYYFVLLLFSLIPSSNGAIIASTPATCGSEDLPYSLSPGELRMFQSPSYPKSISTGTTNNTIPCSASFTRADNTGDLLIYLVNGNMGNFTFQNAVEIDYFNNLESNGYTTYNSIGMRNRIFYGENNPNIAFHFGPQSDIVDWTAFQGLVYAPSNPKLVSNCLLSGESFNLTDSTQIIPIFAYGNRSTQKEELCTWTFTVPSGYKLKIVVSSLKLYTLETLNVTGGTGRTITHVGRYVVDGQQVRIIYAKNHTSYGSNPNVYGFDGYVTLVKPHNLTKGSCQPYEKDNSVTYSNFNKNGYSNDWTCEHTMRGDFKKTYYLKVTRNYYEWYSDIIQVKDSKNTVYPLDFGTVYYYEPSSTEKSDYLNFTSDDSVVQGGFEVLQTPKDCTCYNRSVTFPCDATTNIGFTEYGSNFGYCSNTNCTISIVPPSNCSGRFISAEINIKFRKNSGDSITVYYGTALNSVVSNSSTSMSISYKFLPFVPFAVNLNSGPTPSTVYESPVLYMNLKTINILYIANITLTKENPVFPLDLSRNIYGYYTISVPKGDTLDVSMTFDENSGDQYSKFELFDGMEYMKNLNSLQYPDIGRKYIPRRYQSKSGYFIFGSSSSQHAKVTLFFWNVDAHSVNCPDKNNIFQLDGVFHTFQTNLTAKGGSTETCMYTILNCPNQELHITQLGNTMGSDVLFVAGNDKNHPLFSFNKNSAAGWNAVNLRGMFNSFIVPANDTVTVGIIDSSYDDSNLNPNITSFHGIIYSKSYGYPYAAHYPLTTTFPVINFPRMLKIQFTCKFLDLKDGDEVTVSGNNVTSVGQIITIDNNTAEIIYTSTTTGNRGFLLEFTSSINNSGNSFGIAHKLRFLLFVGPFVLTGFLMIGFLWIKEQTTIDPQYVFSPENARWRYERDILTKNWPLDEHHFFPGKFYDFPGYVDVIAAAKTDEEFGRPNMLVSKFINELDRINKYIIYNLSVPVEHNGKHYEVTYTDLCMTYDWKCFLNDHITILRPKSHWGTFEGQLAEFASEIIEKEIKITYPIGWRGTEPIYFGSLVSGVHLVDEEGHFDYVKAVRLTYNTRDEIVGNISYIWRKKVADYLSNKEHPPSQILEFGLYHNESLPEGLQDVADALTPKFVIMSSIIFAFCVGTSTVFLRKDNIVVGIDWVRSKPILGLAALVCPLLATASAFGLVLWTGEYYNAIVNISPFIVICIGIDDAFLMSAAWHRTNPKLSVARRVAETLSEAAVAISITSLTDMLSFGIGCMTSLPGVRLFCLYTFWGITFTYIYQITYFTAVLAYAGEMEDKGIHSLIGRKCIRPEFADTNVKRWLCSGSICRDDDKKEDICQDYGNKEGISHDDDKKEDICPENDKKKDISNDDDDDQGANRDADKIQDVHHDHDAKQHPGELPTKEPISEEKRTFITKVKFFMKSLATEEEDSDQSLNSHHARETFVNWFFREWFGPQLLLTVSKSMVLVIYLIYLFAALFGCAQIKEGLNPKHLVRSSFYLTDFYILIDETFWQEGLQMQVVVNNPPDLFNPETRSRFNDMVSEFENSHYTMKHNATMMWIYAYENQLEEDEKERNISKPESSEEYYQRAREWLITTGGRRLWELDLVWGANESDPNDRNRLRTFRFQIGLRNYRTPTDHTNSCKLMREIAGRYPDMNITTFHEYYPFADQYLELKPALFQNCLLAVISVFIVALIMIPHIGAAFAIIMAIVSIDVGVLGFMALWGVNLESVSMITIIMSIGFSVDLSAHISYAYVKSPGNSSQKAISALETLGWPVFLGAFTTIVGIMMLTLVDAYIVQIFFKTIFLVIAFSLCHGLLFLPVLLTVLLPNAKIVKKQKINFKAEEMQYVARKIVPKILQKELDSCSVDSKTLQEIDLNNSKT